VADDKAVYAFMPELIQYYLGQDPVLAQVPTYVGFRKSDLAYIRDNIAKLVVKTTGDSGGYGMLMGPFATKREIGRLSGEDRADALALHRATPRRAVRARHLHGGALRAAPDRPPSLHPVRRPRARAPGGLTRVALRRGSYVVNSSQGGGSKDTWVLAPRDG
jgi:uncharacterized circularly permuted ATP-grasp superfamily protein